ncbi:MAG: methylenetetrahydrofolate reductase C-terminal domain-containing protein, partial [Dehalococcoidales bacterium]|nr:methylenetetrahydrofolate reductase C-terminal domain-containing protein [Dehalococcoidales bacterium]
RTNQLKNSILDPNIFCLTWEQIPGQGAFETRQELVLENASKAARGGKICAISIVDNPGGNPAIATEVLCSEIRKLGIEPMVHLAFRDKSRNQVESLLYQLAALDINNLLILTGDYPSNIGFQGKSRPVFDLDAVNGLQLVKEMNLGMEHEIMRRKTRLSPTDFFAGVAFSPFKRDEAEVMGQYYKLIKKIRAGADFIITQIGYDVRKLYELKQWLQIKNIEIPVLTSIHVLSYISARAMHDNRVPGCVVTDKLMSEITDEVKSPDKGLEASLLRAAKLYAISKGMGFAGACISGQGISYENVEFIIEKGNELTSRWQELINEFDYPQTNGFYYFEKNSATGLNKLTLSPRTQKPVRPAIFFLSKLIHVLLFEPKSPLFKPLRFVMARIDSSRILKKAFASVEFWIKAMLYGCMNCGDCALFDVAYLCPVSQCPKNQRNGPCGGSYNGWCEVYPEEKKCIWVRAYQRLKAVGKEESISQNIVPPCDWELWQTSSWLNYFLGRDHISRRIGIKPIKAKNKSGKH